MGGRWSEVPDGGATIVTVRRGHTSTAILHAWGGEGATRGSHRAGSGGGGGSAFGEEGGRLGQAGAVPKAAEWLAQKLVSVKTVLVFVTIISLILCHEPKSQLEIHLAF